jgi:sulfur carrier protein
MKISVNREDHDIDTTTLDDVLAQLGYEGPWLATAVNGELVHREERPAFRLSDGDKVEILSPMQGG